MVVAQCHDSYRNQDRSDGLCRRSCDDAHRRRGVHGRVRMRSS
ncbi:hypothetical protein HMPREF9595_02074 [Cutibacterium acnes HL005PA2]|nr:hypothetical protein HMPREF9574_00022 [Cutibacterium acnes HL074PA1]EFS49178.1 hypothetical protein HMPREF9585_00477 [Cutibacterium acnes HL083PA1]EFS68918.1 hypothetical protein HMPREF9616_01123 [Cutibacterium acnes HL007PA1]EFS98890.1 hypothetical protein HMPREF9609_02675 [Cutibacterium acnes HL027PA1]EFT06075.1 hypothetical protein HMPREF9614_00330 [Cutibacterium acnes HL002PA2]EFT30731.1 hypothetical protein HMPREF9595_02074 [Cutibacterium acnes HL005PA2]EGE91469.1 hypothetical protein